MFRLILTLSAFGLVFGACSDKLPTAQQAVAQPSATPSADDEDEAPPRNPEEHDIYPRTESEAVGGEENANSGGSDDDGLEGIVNLNDATSEQLQFLPGVGPAIAERIVDYRDKRRFEEPIHIKRVRGVGDATFEKLKAHLTVDGKTTLSE